MMTNKSMSGLCQLYKCQDYFINTVMSRIFSSMMTHVNDNTSHSWLFCQWHHVETKWSLLTCHVNFVN